MIPADDRGFTLGDGLFETVLADAGELYDLSAHFDRMAAGCVTLGIPAPDWDTAGRLMRDALERAGLGAARAAVRLTLTAGGGGRGLDRPEPLAIRLVATAAPAPRPVGPARLAISSIRRNEGSPASRLKSLAYLDNVLARREVRAAGADEAVMLNTRGELACAAAANLFWLADGRLRTPALECGVLSGIVRAKVIAAAKELGVAVEEVAESASALVTAEAIFVTNSLVGVRQIAALEGRPCPTDAFIDKLAEALTR